MTVVLQKVIESLRSELEQYGEMLALLEQQQEAAGSGADDVMHSIAAINAQGATIQSARQRRQQRQRDLAQKLGQAVDSSFAHLIPLLPPNYQPLLTALVQENNELLLRVRERAQQNQALLRRSLDFMQRFITTLNHDTKHLPASNILTLDTTSQALDAIA